MKYFNSAQFKKIRKDLIRDPYLCGMIPVFNRFHEWIFKPYFEKVKINPEELEGIKKISKKATLVYVMKNRGQLEYSFFNHCFLREKIPLAHYANGCRTLFWRPIPDIIRHILIRVASYFDHVETPTKSGYLEDLVAQGHSALLNLKVSRELVFGTDEQPLEFIPPLLRAAAKSERPVYLVTQQFLYDRHPEKGEKSWADLLFGEKSNPGMFRKLILFALSYSRRATVKFGEPLNLKEFLKENQNEDENNAARRLNAILLGRLMVDRKSVTGPVQQSPERIIEKILRDKNFKKDLDLLRISEGLTKTACQAVVAKYFKEIAAHVNYTYIDLYDRLIEWITTHVFDGVDLDVQGLNKIKRLAGKYPIVLAPAHKSHIDYLLMSYIFYNHELTLPHICAGINLKFWPVGDFARKGGAFFIRRTFAGNPIYKLVVEHYIRLLICEGYCMEFFIEGTRSRTGKLLKPKMGILSMIMRALGEEDHGAKDIYFVPISINYERILEEKSYMAESHGAEKQKENVGGILQAGRSFRRKYGKVFIRFSEPISLKEFMQDRPPGNFKSDVESFAYKLTYEINRASVVTTTSLVSTAILSAHLGISKVDMLWRIKALQEYLEFKGANLSELIQGNSERGYIEALSRLCKDRLIQENSDYSGVFYRVDESRRLAIDYHKNNSLHFFVSLVCFSKSLDILPGLELSLEEVQRSFESLKKLLDEDFTFSRRVSIRDHLLKVMEFYIQKGLLEWDGLKINVASIRSNREFQFYSHLLDNFFESSYLTLLYIKHVPFKNQDPKRLQKDILEKGAIVYLRGNLKCFEAISKFNIYNALSVYEGLGFVTKDEAGNYSRHSDASISQWEEFLEQVLGLKASVGLPPELKEPASKTEEAMGIYN